MLHIPVTGSQDRGSELGVIKYPLPAWIRCLYW